MRGGKAGWGWGSLKTPCLPDGGGGAGAGCTLTCRARRVPHATSGSALLSAL